MPKTLRRSRGLPPTHQQRWCRNGNISGDLTIYRSFRVSTNKSLLALVTTLLGAPYTSNRMSYDLRRLRLKGLIERIEATNAYRVTPNGQRFAVFYTTLHNRLLRPLMAADRPPSPPEIRQALDTLDRHFAHTIDLARLPQAA